MTININLQYNKIKLTSLNYTFTFKKQNKKIKIIGQSVTTNQKKKKSKKTISSLFSPLNCSHTTYKNHALRPFTINERGRQQYSPAGSIVVQVH